MVALIAMAVGFASTITTGYHTRVCKTDGGAGAALAASRLPAIYSVNAIIIAFSRLSISPQICNMSYDDVRTVFFLACSTLYVLHSSRCTVHVFQETQCRLT